MRVYEIGDQQRIESLRRRDRAAPEPGPGDVLLRVRAACLNHRDLLIVTGRYGPRRSEQRVPLSDGVGEVTALGAGVTSLAVGERVIAPHFVHWLDGAFAPAVFGADVGVTLDGWLAEQIVLPAAALVSVPATMTDLQALPLGAAALTAWQALVEVGRIKAGDTVLVLGTGGVSLFALQIATLHGARVVVTSSSDAKLERARALGADVTVNYATHHDWAAELRRLGATADIVVETGGLPTLAGSIDAAAPNARIAVIGALAGAHHEAGARPGVMPNFGSVIGKNLVLRGITAGSRRMLADLVRAADRARLQPVIDSEFGFDDAARAYARLQAGPFGKVALRVV